MKVKTRNLMELILQTICLILLFISPFFIGYIAVGDYVVVSEDNLASVGLVNWGEGIGWSIFKLARWDGAGTFAISPRFKLLFAYGMILLCTVGVVLFIKQFVSKGAKSNNLIAIFPPIIELILLSIFTFAGGHFFSEFDGYSYNHWADTYEKDFLRPGICFYLFICTLLILITISVIGYILAQKRGILDDPQKAIVLTELPSTSNADELKKYKELLDLGVISAEEFEKKKKQLLEL